jgi:acid phosphatase family membrane protein YuiD
MNEEKIDRLLRSAAEARKEETVSMPFGFDTRVVALWRAGAAKSNGVMSLLRRVALVSAVIIVASTIAAVREIGQNREIGESLTNEYAIADSAIQTEFLR